MGSTKISDIYKMFLLTIQDYRIKKMFIDTPEVADDLMQNFLIDAVSKFINCSKQINELDFKNDTFLCELDTQEKTIIKDLMVIAWMNWNVNDITQMNWALNDNDFKHFSEEKNLREKSEYADRLREKVSQDMVNYGLSHTPFKEWAVGNYGL